MIDELTDEKKEAQLAAVMALKAKGVTGIKVEMEASLKRHHHGNSDDNDDDDYECEDCSDGSNNCETCDAGYNHIHCDTCDGEGRVDQSAEYLELHPRALPTRRCEECNGTGELDECPNENCDDGYVTCSTCNGDYDVNPDHNEVVDGEINWASEYECFKWLMQRIADNTNTPLRPSVSNDYYVDELRLNRFEWMKYAYFYNDNSVDSELTFTIKLDKPENIFYLPQVLQAFKEMAELIGEPLDVKGAGLHTALLWDADCNYPSNEDDYMKREASNSNRLPEDDLKNFKRAVTQLLPALYFLGTTNEVSRGLKFRMPQVSVNYRHDMEWGSVMGNAKYSAITYRQGAMEFRLFDTCYDSPNAILDNIVVISNCLRYLTPTYKSPGVDGVVGSSLNFGNDASNDLQRFYTENHHIDALAVGLEKLKPAYYTVGQLKKQRGFTRTKTSIKRLVADRQTQAQLEYEEYIERFDWKKSNEAIYIRGVARNDVINGISRDELRELNEAIMEEKIKSRVDDHIGHFEKQRRKAEDYIKTRVNDLATNERGRYTLLFN